MRSDRERLLDILEAIEKIEKHKAQLKAEVQAILQELDEEGY